MAFITSLQLLIIFCHNGSNGWFVDTCTFMQFRRNQLVSIIFGELVRYWIVSCLSYFIAVGAELEILKFILEVYIIGLPIVLTALFVGILCVSLYLFALNRWQWERPVYYVGFGEEQQRIRRLSLTDLSTSDVEIFRLHTIEMHQREMRR